MNKTKKTAKQKTFMLTLTAMFCALIIAMTFTPYIGYIVYGLLSITTLHIIVLLGSTLLGPWRSTFLGAVWGVSCLLYAVTSATADAAIFLDPRISVIPRILVGLAAGWCYFGFNTLFKKWMSPERAGDLAALLTAIFGTLTNTVLVLSAISIFGTGVMTLGKTLTVILETAIGLNGLVELGAAVVLVPLLHHPLSKLFNRYMSL